MSVTPLPEWAKPGIEASNRIALTIEPEECRARHARSDVFGNPNADGLQVEEAVKQERRHDWRERTAHPKVSGPQTVVLSESRLIDMFAGMLMTAEHPVLGDAVERLPPP